MDEKEARTREILLLLKAFDDEHKGAIEKIESVYKDELVEETKTLSDKIWKESCKPIYSASGEHIKIEDVKQTFYDIKEEIKGAGTNNLISEGVECSLIRMIDKKAGKRLI